MFIINYILFIIVTAYGLMFLTGRKAVLKSPFDANVKMRLSGLEMFWVLTFSTGIVALSAPGGIDLMAIRLLVLEIFCIWACSISNDSPIWSIPLKLYVFMLLWVIAGCFYGNTPAYGLRVFLKYLYPLAVALCASAIVYDRLTYMKSLKLARVVSLCAIAYYFIPYISWIVPGLFWYATAGCINFISIMAISVGLYFFTKEKRKNLMYAIIFIIPCFVLVFRTSIMGSLVALMGFSFIKFKTKSLPIIAGILVAGVVAVFAIPSLHDKMFNSASKGASLNDFQDGKLSMENVNTNARASMWEHLENRFFVDHEMVGSGSGSVQEYMYTHTIYGGLKVPHSDFVQMKCDHGLIGLGLYILITLSVFLHCCWINWGTNMPIVKLASAIAGASMIGVGVCLYSDNVINYSMATLSMPYGLYGMALGLQRHFQRQ